VSDTPRTDAECRDIKGDAYMVKLPIHGDYVPSDLARQLEEELNAAKDEIEKAYFEGCIDGHNAAQPDSNGKDVWELSRAKRVMEGKQ
jgi:hypothetical protein